MNEFTFPYELFLKILKEPCFLFGSVLNQPISGLPYFFHVIFETLNTISHPLFNFKKNATTEVFSYKD